MASEHSELVDRFRIAFKRLIPPAEKVVLAVSGGGDSTALASLYVDAFPERRSLAVVAHFNHQLRPEADADAAWVVELSHRLGLEAHLDSWCRDPTTPAHEASARSARYRFLEQTAVSVEATAVLTAHTADDQAETVLHHILRGTGIHGLAGMREKRRLKGSVALVRPLLTTSGRELREYLLFHQIRHCEDSSNRSGGNFRSRVRSDVMPVLEAQFRRSPILALCRLADQAGQIALLLDSWADSQLMKMGAAEKPDCESMSLPLAAFSALNPFERQTILHRALRVLACPMGGVSSRLLTLASAVCDSTGRAAVQLPRGWEVRRTPLALLIHKRPQTPNP